MINEIYIALLACPVAIAAGFGFIALHKRRSDFVLRKWAAENHFELLHSERCFASGPFCWLTSSKTTVFLVTVRDPKNRERSGWVRCGSCFEGVLFSDRAEVKWKEQ
jgi:hypothetical protein